jgi:hypothetical protein
MASQCHLGERDRCEVGKSGQGDGEPAAVVVTSAPNPIARRGWVASRVNLRLVSKAANSARRTA